MAKIVIQQGPISNKGTKIVAKRMASIVSEELENEKKNPKVAIKKSKSLGTGTGFFFQIIIDKSDLPFPREEVEKKSMTILEKINSYLKRPCLILAKEINI